MKVNAAIAEILKREGVTDLVCYPRNGLIEAAAEAGIRPILVRQERTGVHMADALGRVSCGDRVGVFAMQQGPGTENAFGGVAQAFAESVPLVVIPAGHPRAQAGVKPNFSAAVNFRNVTKSVEQVTVPSAVPDAMRRAFTQAKNGRPGPAMVEVPVDLWTEEVPEPLVYQKTPRLKVGPDPRAVSAVAEALLAAERPVIFAGQGIHYAKAWKQLQDLAELLEAPVGTSNPGKSAFDETHPLALGAGSTTHSKQFHRMLQKADLIFGVGCSWTATPFNMQMPKGKAMVHLTLDPGDINKDIASNLALVGDAGLALDALLEELRDRLHGKPRGRLAAVTGEIRALKEEWLGTWMPHLTSNTAPLSPYRVIWDLMHTVDVANTIVTHDSGSPRDQLVPFWVSKTPRSYIGWGKSTQLGYGLGLAIGAKLAAPEKLCINVWGDAAIGFTGMDIETAVRAKLPILSILMNNSVMAAELNVMKYSTETYHSTDISGNYADFARALGAWGERVTEPQAIVPAIKRAVEKTKEGTPALLEFITERQSPRSAEA
ncbi:MAG TPA: thiamine pyrophosphate-requiring protein [Stellaceae bacterium]|nr:thiamine pyrophosphate-requiring protein [Stellaceae bacterium]